MTGDDLDAGRSNNVTMDRSDLVADEPRPVLMLGFDALDFRYLDRFADSLPTLSQLRSEGIEAPLRSTFPPITGSAWPSMYTGVDPSRHGSFGFFTHSGYPDESTVVTRTDVRAPALWNYLTALDLPSIVLNVPVTYPAEEIEGVLLPGDLSPADASGFPDNLRAELNEQVGEYRIYADDSRPVPDRFVELLDIRQRAVEYLLSEKEWTLAFVQVQVTDTVFHKTADGEAHRRIYERADELAGRLFELVPTGTNVVVCSDHGMGPVTGHRTYINEVLAREGLVERGVEDTAPTLNRGAEVEDGGLDGERANNDLSTRVLFRFLSLSRRLEVSPADLYVFATRLGIESLVKTVVPASVRESTSTGVDWRASRAYCGTSSEYGIRVNLRERESDGVVTEDEYEQVRDELVEILSGLETPTGDPAFKFVKRREEVYDGPLVKQAPDVLFMPSDDNHDISTDLAGREFVPVDAHNHRQEGVFLGMGPLFDAGADLNTLSLTDIAPTVMALLGCAVPDRMTGTVPDTVSCPVETEAYPDVPFGIGAGPDADDEVMDRLEDLGYM